MVTLLYCNYRSPRIGASIAVGTWEFGFSPSGPHSRHEVNNHALFLLQIMLGIGFRGESIRSSLPMLYLVAMSGCSLPKKIKERDWGWDVHLLWPLTFGNG